MARWISVALLLALTPSLTELPASPPRAIVPPPEPESHPPEALAWDPLPDDQIDAIFAPRPRRWPTQLAKGDLGPGAARAAGELLHDAPEEIAANCTRFVGEAYAHVGAPLEGRVVHLWTRAETARAVHFDPRPEPGDIAFFDHTFDANRNGLVDDPLTHVAIVVSVEPDGDIWLAHGGTRGTSALFRMYLGDEPDRNGGDLIRRPKDTDAPGTSSLARDLWRGFARVRREDLSIWLGKRT